MENEWSSYYDDESSSEEEIDTDGDETDSADERSEETRSNRLMPVVIFGKIIKSSQTKLQSLLFDAARLGKASRVKDILYKGAINVDSVDSKGKSALIYAMALIQYKPRTKACLNCLQLLLDHGANPNVGGLNGLSPYFLSIAIQNVKCTSLFLSYGASQSISQPEFLSLICEIFAWQNPLKKRFKQLLKDFNRKVDIVDVYLHMESLQYSTIILLVEPQNLLFLLEEKIVVSEKQWKLFRNKTSSIETTCPRIIDSMCHLMKYKAFHWNMWCGDSRMEETDYRVVVEIIQSALQRGLPCIQFLNEDGCVVSPFINALRFNFGNWFSPDFLRYLAVNLYFTIDDYKLISNDLVLSQRLHNVCNQKFWRLETLCLLTVSTALMKNQNCSNSNNSSRLVQVDVLPLPERFKTLLNFKGSLSRLCSYRWRGIRRLYDLTPQNNSKNSLSSYEDGGLLCVTKIHPLPQFLAKCGCRLDCKNMKFSC